MSQPILKKIISRDNPRIKSLHQLKLKKYRQLTNKFFIENLNIILDAAQAGFYPEAIFITPEFLSGQAEGETKLNAILARVPEVYEITAGVNKSFSELATPAGIAALYPQPAITKIQTGPVVYLHKISDPGNLGAIIRSAVVFGWKNIIVDEGTADVYNSKTIQAAKDAIFKVRIVYDRERQELLGLRHKKIPLLVASFSGQNTARQVLAKYQNCCVVLGNEAHGVDEAIIKLATAQLSIPMTSAMESLNVAATAAILFYLYYESWPKIDIIK